MYLCGNFILSDFCLSLFSFFLILSNIYCSTTVLLVENFDVELTEKPVTVYNFQVEDFHTYHVGCFYVLVHNADYNQSPKEIMAERTKGLDTREHSSKYKQISAKEKSR